MSSFLLGASVVPADLKLVNLFNDALCYCPAAGHDQPPRHQVKRAAWVEKREHSCSGFCVWWQKFHLKEALFWHHGWLKSELTQIRTTFSHSPHIT